MADAREALIFDMDGVIVDSNPLHRMAWEAFNRRYGLPTTEDMHERMYGMYNAQIVRDYFGDSLSDEEVEARGAAKEQMYRDLVGPLLPGVLVPGVQEFLERHQDVPIGCGTNAERKNVEYVLELAGLTHLFRAVVDGHQVKNPKPAPDIYLKVAELLGVAPARCVVFEDSHAGVAAARAAGMDVVALTTTHKEFPGVALVVDDFLDPRIETYLAARA